VCRRDDGSNVDDRSQIHEQYYVERVVARNKKTVEKVMHEMYWNDDNRRDEGEERTSYMNNVTF